MMNRAWTFAAALGAALSIPAAAQDAGLVWIETVGTARSLDGEALLYTEHHRIGRRDGLPVRHTVRYEDADGRLIAFKRVDYQRSASSPAFELVDVRDGYVEGARHTEDGRYVIYRQEPGQRREEKEIAFGPDLVTDAGFDGHVRRNIGRLEQGGRLRFRLALPGSLRTVDFRATLTGRAPDGDRPAVQIRVEPDSLLRWLVDPLDLVYTTQPLQLREYRGRTNIRDGRGGRFDAVIRFDDEQPADGPHPIPDELKDIRQP